MPRPELENRASTKTSRRKHKNSKLGCEQCKERRMKCNEELPVCRNCLVRQTKIPCSYLSYTETEKKEFLRKKALNLNNELTTSHNENPINLRMIRHSHTLYSPSQLVDHTSDVPSSQRARLYFISHINEQYFNYDHAFKSFMSLPCLWLALKLEQKRDLLENNGKDDSELVKDIQILKRLSIKYKSETLLYLRDLVLSTIKTLHHRESASKHFEDMILPSFILQNLDLLSLPSLKFYYTTGSSSILREIYDSNEEAEQMSRYIATSIIANTNTLFIPNYPKDFLYGFVEVLNEFKPFIISTENKELLNHHSCLVEFITTRILEPHWDKYYNKNSIIPYEPLDIYELQYKFARLIPGNAFSSNLEKSAIARIFYTFYHSLARCLDNIFPESRYLSLFRFIGPTSFYPINPSDVFSDDLTEDLKYFASYSLRILCFFSKRYEFYFNNLVDEQAFRDYTEDDRFKSRKALVDEVYVRDFRNYILKPENYPRPRSEEKRYTINSPGTSSNDIYSFIKTEFLPNSSPQSSNSNDVLSNDFESHGIKKNGLLVCDYDPTENEWPDKEVKSPKYSNETIGKFLKDRQILMNFFTR